MNWRSLNINLNTHRKFQSSIILSLWVGWYWEGDVFCYTIILHGGGGELQCSTSVLFLLYYASNLNLECLTGDWRYIKNITLSAINRNLTSIYPNLNLHVYTLGKHTFVLLDF